MNLEKPQTCNKRRSALPTAWPSWRIESPSSEATKRRISGCFNRLRRSPVSSALVISSPHTAGTTSVCPSVPPGPRPRIRSLHPGSTRQAPPTHAPQRRSKSPSLNYHFADAHGVGLYALAQRAHALDNLLVRQLSIRVSNRHQHCRRNAVSCNRDPFATHLVQLKLRISYSLPLAVRPAPCGATKPKLKTRHRPRSATGH